MLKKLYLHEFKALFRWLKFVWIGIIALAIINRGMYAVIDYFVDRMAQSPSVDVASNPIYRLLIALTGSLTVIYAFGAFAGLLISFGVVVVRFYKNFFTSEGYFTFSTPITANQHVCCKLICGVVVILLSMAVCGLSLVINFLFTDVGANIVSFLGEITISDPIIRIHIILYVLELILIYIASICLTNLTYYCAISFGQSFKNKIGGSIISYIVINLIFNSISAFLSIFLSLGGSILTVIFDFNKVDITTVFHVVLILSLLLEVALCVAFFIITANRTAKKLNLE